MAETIGAFEAKTHLSALLGKVAAGAEFTITKRGKPVAKLVPIKNARKADIDKSIAHLKSIRKGIRLDMDWKTLRDVGRR